MPLLAMKLRAGRRPYLARPGRRLWRYPSWFKKSDVHSFRALTAKSNPSRTISLRWRYFEVSHTTMFGKNAPKADHLAAVIAYAKLIRFCARHDKPCP